MLGLTALDFFGSTSKVMLLHAAIDQLNTMNHQ